MTFRKLSAKQKIQMLIPVLIVIVIFAGIFINNFRQTEFIDETSGKCQRPLIVDIPHLEPGYIEYPKVGGNGVAIDLVEELEARTGCQLVKYITSLPKGIDNMTHFRSDLILMAGANAKVKFQSFHLLYKVKKEFIIRKAKYVREFTLGDYVNKTKVNFGSYQGSLVFLPQAQDEKLQREGRLRATSNIESMYITFVKGKSDVIFSETSINSYMIRKYNLEDQVERVLIPDQHIDMGYYISNKRLRPYEFDLIVATMDEIVRDGTFLKIISKYIPLEEFEKYTIK